MNIKEIARKETVVAEIMENREKGDTSTLIKLCSDNKTAFTIDNFEACEITNDSGEKEMVYAYTVSENKKEFFFAGFVLKKIFDSIVNAYQGDYESAYNAMKREKLVVRFGEKKTKNKQTVTTIDVLD